jgi:N6-adenosine-specific RNA methylase IME4
MTSYEDHPIAGIFPLLGPAELAELAADINAHGQRHPILLWEGKVLDGRNRARACELAGVAPLTEQATCKSDEEAAALVVSLNAQRRHLTASQKAMSAVELERVLGERAKERQRKAGGDKRSPAARAGSVEATLPQAVAPHRGWWTCSLCGKGNFPQRKNDHCIQCGVRMGNPAPLPSPDRLPQARAQAAKAVGVSERYVQDAKRIVEEAPDLAPKVTAGLITIPEATKLAALPEPKRAAVVARVEAAPGEVKVTEAIRQLKREEVAAKVAELPPDKYRVIYADPPWQYNDSRAGLDDYGQTAAADHYPTMSVAELSALDVRSLADTDAVLFCWATFPLLPDALEVVRAWGFKYKTAFVWSKVRPNFGHYHTADAELLLVCTRGSATPDVDKRERQVQEVPREGRHSAKPEHFRALVDRLYPNGRRIELFRRGEAPAGWDVWGNEAKADARP